jgi:PAS domain S-box-containing protein
MPARQWDAASKAKVVLEALRGKPEAAVCKRHGVQPAEFRRWRTQFLANIAKPFEAPGPASGGADVASLFAGLAGSGEKISESLQLARELIEALPVPVFFKSRDGRNLGANKAWETYFGIPRESFLGRTVEELFVAAPGVGAVHQAVDEDLWRNPGTRSYELLVPIHDGSQRYTLNYKATFIGRDGKVAGLIGTIIDITERRQAERELRDSEQRFRSLTALSSDWYWEQDEQFRLTSMSSRFTERTGLDSTPYIGQKRWERPALNLTEADWERHRAQLERHEPFFDFEMERKGSDGNSVWISLSGEPVFGEGRRFLGYRGVGTDVTERKRAQAVLRAAYEELARSNSELQQFAYVASHDLQEPLRMIGSYTQLLERRYGDKFDQDAREFMGFIVEGATRMKQLIEDLLAYSRVGTRGKELQRVQSQAALDRALVNLRAAIEANGAAVTHGELPEVNADDTQLTQLLQNLIGNAIKFRREGEQPRIHVDAEETGGEWRFSVADNGIGIESQYYDRIFMVFQRLHTRDEYPGTGIGLAICKKVVDRHGGRIWVESAPGQGSKFLFTLSKVQKEKT